MKTDKAQEIVDKVKLGWIDEFGPEIGKHLDLQLNALKSVLLSYPREDGTMPMEMANIEGKVNTHLIPISDIILKQPSAKDVLDYPIEVEK